MKYIRDYITRWRLRRVIHTLGSPMQKGATESVKNFASALDATSLMAKGLKPSDLVSISVSRKELDGFISYMADLHAKRVGFLQTAMIGLATLVVKDESCLPDDAMKFLKEEFERAKKGKVYRVQSAFDFNQRGK